MNSFKLTPLRTFILLWFIFATLYVLYGEWNRFQRTVYQAAYNRGQTDAVAQVIGEAQKCQPFPIYLGEAKVTLMSLECAAAAQEKPEAKK